MMTLKAAFLFVAPGADPYLRSGFDRAALSLDSVMEGK